MPTKSNSHPDQPENTAPIPYQHHVMLPDERGGASAKRPGTSNTPLPTPLPIGGASPSYEARVIEDPTRTPGEGARNRTPVRDIDKEASSGPIVEIEARDYGTGFEGVARPMPGGDIQPPERPSTSVPARPATPATPPSASMSRSNTTPDPDAYLRSGTALPTFDLGDDEGIPLVSRVNALLSRPSRTVCGN